MSTIQRLGLADFERLLDDWQPRRQIDEFHVHHTWRPRRADFRGLATVEAMRRYHVQHAGMSDIAQHLTIDPQGGLWTGRPFDKAPASIRGRNGDARRGPFMIEMVGNFDTGNDVLDGAQKAAVQAVVVAVLRKFGLGVEAIRFHNEKVFRAGKTCPGTSLDLAAFRAEIAALLDGTRSIERAAQSDARLDPESVRAFASTARDAGDEDVAEAPHMEVPERRWMLAQQAFLAELMDADGGARGAGAGFDMLKPYVVNLSKGVLSTQGAFLHASDNSLRTIAEKHLPDYIATQRATGRTPRIVFYAHGGLVDEAGALRYARTVLPWWLAHGVYPIFFVWESGLLETLRRAPREMGAARGIGDLTDWLLEGVTQHAARAVWQSIKTDAENASLPWIERFAQPGGAWQLAQALRPLLERHKDKVELHAIGHSTGPIFLAKFLPLLTAMGRRIRTLSYLAPAIRTDRFKALVQPMLEPGGGIDALTLYTMTDEAERDDTVARIYRKSLLYFVREACEDKTRGRVLGLADDVSGDAGLRTRFGMPADPGSAVSFSQGNCAIELSPTRDAPVQNPRTAALAHGAFDNDAATMTAVLTRVLGSAPVFDRADKQFPSMADFERAQRAAPMAFTAPARSEAPAAPGLDTGTCPTCGTVLDAPPAAEAWASPVDDATAPSEGASADIVDAVAAVDWVEEPQRYPPSAIPFDSGLDSGEAPAAPQVVTDRKTTRRLALCVGIDRYGKDAYGRDISLRGCVADSRRWQAVLKAAGFDARTLHDRAATRATVLAQLDALIAQGRAGDVLVYQFAGHGTQVADLSSDESDGFDEAWVPVDFRDGALLLDDDIHAATLKLRAGAALTLLLDCCHSGTSTRFMLRAAPPPPATDQRVRFLELDTAAAEAFARARAGDAGTRAVVERGAPPGVVQFAACRDDQFAYETGSQGDFTRHASGVLAQAVRERWSNRAFIDAVVQRFGPGARQNPLLLPPAKGLDAHALLAPLPRASRTTAVPAARRERSNGHGAHAPG